ncbi:MAG: hypothetical protein GXO27_04580 [Chlorobi bacterium]|nr:hypothetical protein [Chlorobiota bacterium]
MPINQNAVFRYRVLDDLLRTSYGYTVAQMVEIVSRRMEDELGRGPVSERTIYQDLRFLAAEPPGGFGAPIIRINGRYKYEDPTFSIFPFDLNYEDLVSLLKLREMLDGMLADNDPLAFDIRKTLNKLLKYGVIYHSEKRFFDLINKIDLLNKDRGISKHLIRESHLLSDSVSEEEEKSLHDKFGSFLHVSRRAFRAPPSRVRISLPKERFEVWIDHIFEPHGVE